MSTSAITGGCQCGAVRYEISGPLTGPAICHCSMCQKAFGSFFAPLVSAPVAGFRVTRGEIAIFTSSDVVERGFCSNCGTPLTFRYVDRARTSVALGSLDDPSAVKPLRSDGIEGMMPWFADLATMAGGRTDDDPDPRLAAIARTNHQHPDHDTSAWPEGLG